MTEDEVRTLALSLPETEEAPHFDATSFRVRGKIYLTLGEGRGDMQVVLKLPPHIQEAVRLSDPAIVEPAEGYWGRKGWTRVDFHRMETAMLTDLVRLAWRGVAPKRVIAMTGEG